MKLLPLVATAVVVFLPHVLSVARVLLPMIPQRAQQHVEWPRIAKT